MIDCKKKFSTAKFSMLHGFTKDISVDVLYLNKCHT